MESRLRRVVRHSVTIASLWVSALGCRTSEHPHDAVPSVALAPSQALGASAPQDRAAWRLTEELAKLRPATSFAPSEHGPRELEGRVLVNDAALSSASQTPAGSFEVGAVLVAEHRAVGEPERSMLLSMRKRAHGYDPAGGDWEYGIADATGAFSQRGRLFACGRCHAEARRDYVFGVPRWRP